MSFWKRLQIFRNFSSKLINPSSNHLSRTCSSTISSSTPQKYQTKWFQKEEIRKTMISCGIVGSLVSVSWDTLPMVISCGIFGSLVYTSWDTVPFVNRTCRVFFPRIVEKLLGDLMFDVPKHITIIEEHSEIVRLRSILSHIVEANKQISSLSWEIYVIDGKSDTDDDLGCACAVSNGKIFISTQFLEDFTTDVEIAAIIGHEVAHAVARHTEEDIVLVEVSRWIPLQVIRLCITDPRVLELETIADVIYYYRRQCEFEAAYIGMMLMASAGYDPKSAPNVYLKFRKLYGDSDFVWWNSNSTQSHTHPSNKDRAKKLMQVMEEVSTIYSCSEKKVSCQSRLWIFREIVTQFRERKRILFFMAFIHSEIAEYFRGH